MSRPARHVALGGPDHGRKRLRVATEMLELAGRAGNRALALQARNWRVVDLLELGDGPAVHDELDAYGTLSAEARLPAYGRRTGLGGPRPPPPQRAPPRRGRHDRADDIGEPCLAPRVQP